VQTAATFDGSIHFLPGLGGEGSSALDIDNNGNVVGSATLPSGLVTHAAFWPASGGIADLGTLGGNWSQAIALNASRHITGQSRTASGQVHAFIYHVDANGTVLSQTDLGVLSGNSSYAYDINNDGMVVGTSDSKAFLWNGSQMIDLNTEIPTGSGWNLTHASAINNSGTIVGWGTLGNRYAAFKLVAGCVADFNNDGQLDFFDVQAFLNLFTAGNPKADINSDGQFNFFDVQAFLNLFAAGCP
jgi:probable HAF family extracellular repeat protein